MPIRKTQEEFEYDINKKLGSEYVVLGEYVNNHTKIKMYHTVCKNIFFKMPKDAVRGSGCPFCYGVKPALYDEQWVKENTPLPYHYVDGYTLMSEKCYFYCDVCQQTFLQSPARLICQKIYGCDCSPTKKKTHEEFLKELGDDCLNEYDILDQYINYETKIRIRHKKCGVVFKMTPEKFILRYNGVFCPICYYNKSNGEVRISRFLTQHQIEYETNFMFKDLKLRLFDFYLSNNNVCIEYDGEQHFQPVECWGGEKGLTDCQRRDREKNEYCLNNNIPLFRIPYWDKQNIEQILEDILINKNLEVINKYMVTAI